jgi:ArsR family transcriptional regulator, virulence genes transcriptional regulator
MSAITATDLRTMRKHVGDAASMLRALSHEARLLVLCELAVGERSAGELVERSGLSQSALSQHLSKLREQGLVTTRREAQSIFYRIADPKAGRLLGVLHEIYCKR